MVELKESMPVSFEKIYKAITDYESYPDFLEGVENVRVIESKGNVRLIEYTVNVIKSVTYVLKTTENPSEGISWELQEGSAFKKNSGFWKLKSEGSNSTFVHYGLDISFNFFVPKMIINGLVSNQVPKTFQAFKERAMHG